MGGLVILVHGDGGGDAIWFVGVGGLFLIGFEAVVDGSVIGSVVE